MKFLPSVISGFKNYSSVEGRASRSEFWNWMLFCYLGGPATVILDRVVFPASYRGDPFFSYPLNALFVLVVMVPSVTVGVRRLHDVNRAGAWLFLWFTVIGIIPLLVWACNKGTEGSNRFGGDPLADAAGKDAAAGK